jgi:hypothetical protein
MSCEQFPLAGPQCRTIQVIAPDPLLVTGSIPGNIDPSIDESGSTPIPLNTTRMDVLFTIPKISENYRFEYLYVDAIAPDPNVPGAVEVVPVQTTRYGFSVKLAGLPLADGYILRWRVVVIDVASTIFIDAPELIRVQLPVNARVFTATFTNLRSNEIYGFSELRVENLTDPPDTQRIILVQVTEKTTSTFTVGINPRPENAHYFLVARTP